MNVGWALTRASPVINTPLFGRKKLVCPEVWPWVAIGTGWPGRSSTPCCGKAWAPGKVAERARPDDLQRPASHLWPVQMLGYVDRTARFGGLAQCVRYLSAVHVQRHSVVVVQMVECPGVVGVGVAEEDGTQVLRSPAQ